MEVSDAEVHVVAQGEISLGTWRYCFYQEERNLSSFPCKRLHRPHALNNENQRVWLLSIMTADWQCLRAAQLPCSPSDLLGELKKKIEASCLSLSPGSKLKMAVQVKM